MAEPAATPSFWKRPIGIAVIAFATILILGPIFSALGFGASDNAEPTSTVTAAESEATPSQADATAADITNDIKTLVGNDSAWIRSASDDGAVTIETSLVDPRADGPNDDTAAAMRICEAAAAEYPGRNIRVNEDDETAWVVLMTTRFQDYPIGECFEY